MSVPKGDRGESAAQFLDTAREIRIFTQDRAKRLPNREVPYEGRLLARASYDIFQKIVTANNIKVRTLGDAEEMRANHSELPHGGVVIRSGKTGLDGEHRHTIEYSLKLDSNPEFTASVLVAYARAICRMAQRGETGCRTVFDIAPADLSPLSGEALRKTML